MYFALANPVLTDAQRAVREAVNDLFDGNTDTCLARRELAGDGANGSIVRMGYAALLRSTANGAFVVGLLDPVRGQDVAAAAGD